MKLRPARRGDREEIRAAIFSLKMARDRLKLAGAERALAAVRSALKSAEGAQRHVERLERATVDETIVDNVEDCQEDACHGECDRESPHRAEGYSNGGVKCPPTE